MHELITQLTEKVGITPQQASHAIDTIKEFVKEKFPMMAGAIDNFLPSGAAATTAPDTTTSAAAAAPGSGGGMLDKISDFIPGDAGEKVEDFVKGMFGDKK